MAILGEQHGARKNRVLPEGSGIANLDSTIYVAASLLAPFGCRLVDSGTARSLFANGTSVFVLTDTEKDWLP
jgi:hypothetical protein